MAKKFDIHEWKAKQRLAEVDNFTPDLEDDELKRSKIQQMMAKEKESEYELSDEEKDNLTDMTNEFVRKLTDVRGGNYSGDRLLAALQFVILNIQDMEPMLYTDTDGDGTPDVVDNDDEGFPFGDPLADFPELEEQNVTGTGTSFNAGDGEGYATPNAFAKKGKWKRKKTVYEKQEWPQDEDSTIDWGLATDDEIRAIGGDVYYGPYEDGIKEPTEDSGQRMLVPPEGGFPVGRDLDGDGDIDIDDIDFTDPEANIEPERLDAPKDVEYIMNLIFQKINNRQEYGAFIRSALEMDVPQKTTSFQQNFKDMPSFKNQLIKFFGDEKDDTFMYNVEKKDESGLKKKVSKGASKQSQFKAMDYRSRKTGIGQDLDKTIDKISGKYSSEKEKSKRKRKKEFDKWYKKSQEK